MLFESCDVDSRSGNVLTSPELSLQSDEELTVTMLFPFSGNDRRLTVYLTSATKHPTTMLGTYFPPTELDSSSYANSTNSTDSTNGTDTNGTNSNSSFYVNGRDVTHTICLPAGIYQLAFIGADMKNATQSQAALMDVSLTGVSCTYSPLSGKHYTKVLHL